MKSMIINNTFLNHLSARVLAGDASLLKTAMVMVLLVVCLTLYGLECFFLACWERLAISRRAGRIRQSYRKFMNLNNLRSFDGTLDHPKTL